MWLSQSSVSVHRDERNDTYQLIPVLTVPIVTVSSQSYNLTCLNNFMVYGLLRVWIDNSLIIFNEVVCPTYYNTTSLGKF